MYLKVALIGLLQSGKSTLLSAVSGREITGTSGHIEEAMVNVPDERLEWLTELYKPKKTVHATIDCLDLPGFNFSDEHTRAASRRLINQIRTVDTIVCVMRGFEYGGNKGNPGGDLNELTTELLLADLELVETRIKRLEKQSHKPTKTQAQDKAELAVQKKLQAAIESEKPISSAIENDAELAIIKSLGFLTLKPEVIVVNVAEDKLDDEIDLGVDVGVVKICAELEKQLSQLDEESRAAFMADLGITESAVSKFVNSCYDALGLISFLTAEANNEVRAWPVKAGTSALDAAGKVHSDIKRGFIRAETMSYEDLRELGDEKAVKAAGKSRLEGKEYVVKDGDIINFRFNV